MVSIDLVTYKKYVDVWLKRYVYLCELPNYQMKHLGSLKEIDRYRATIIKKYEYICSDSQFDYYTEVRI